MYLPCSVSRCHPLPPSALLPGLFSLARHPIFPLLSSPSDFIFRLLCRFVFVLRSIRILFCLSSLSRIFFVACRHPSFVRAPNPIFGHTPPDLSWRAMRTFLSRDPVFLCTLRSIRISLRATVRIFPARRCCPNFFEMSRFRFFFSGLRSNFCLTARRSNFPVVPYEFSLHAAAVCFISPPPLARRPNFLFVDDL